jgi:hypothetical protein
MSIIALRAWYLEDYEPITELEKRSPDIRLNKKNLLKTGLRADFLEDSEVVKKSDWFTRYLDGENVEFYIEGSGGYCVSNIDLISHEIYFTKQSLLSQLEPVIFFSPQIEYSPTREALKEAFEKTIEILNKKSRLPLTLIESYRSEEGAIRLNKTMMRKMRKSLLFIADTTPVTSIDGKENKLLIPSPNVCVEIGYAIQSKKSEQILLLQEMRSDIPGEFPFDLPKTQILKFEDHNKLEKLLSQGIQAQLGRFKLFS